MGPLRLSGAVAGPSTSPLGDARHVVTLHAYLLPDLPYVAFTLYGVLLWKRWHSLATSLVALGFAAVLLVKVAHIYTYLTFQPPVSAHRQGDPFGISLYYVVTSWQYYLELLGFWAAAVGLLWHASRKR